jgi:hypothetical protein
MRPRKTNRPYGYVRELIRDTSRAKGVFSLDDFPATIARQQLHNALPKLIATGEVKVLRKATRGRYGIPALYARSNLPSVP